MTWHKSDETDVFEFESVIIIADVSFVMLLKAELLFLKAVLFIL